MESTDRRTIPFLDVLIENELKKVISNSAVQQYVGKIHQYFIMSRYMLDILVARFIHN